jgi:hypothetical protein
MIWSDSYLNTLLNDAEFAIAQEVDYEYKRTAIAITQGKSLYDLPTGFNKLIRITWKGEPVDPISFRDMMVEFPNSAIVSEAEKNEYSEGQPRFYCIHPTFSQKIKLLPTPNETLSATGDVYGSAGIETLCIISYWSSGDLPTYTARRTKKAYAMCKAFLREGKGQNKVASDYYKMRYDFLLNMFKKINNGVYLSRESVFAERERPRDPVLPSNYERICYK